MREEPRCHHYMDFFSISSNYFFFYIRYPSDRIARTTTFGKSVVEYWVKREIAQWVRNVGSIRRPIVQWADVLPLSYISLPCIFKSVELLLLLLLLILLLLMLFFNRSLLWTVIKLIAINTIVMDRSSEHWTNARMDKQTNELAIKQINKNSRLSHTECLTVRRHL